MTEENKTKTLGNKIAEESEDNTDMENEDINNGDKSNANNVEKGDNGMEDDEEAEPEIRNIELTGKDADNLNSSRKKNNNLTRKRNNQINGNSAMGNKNLTQKNNNNILKPEMPLANESSKEEPSGITEASDIAASGNTNNSNKGKMRALNNVAMNLFNHQVVLKLFHFQTELYGAHKASDAYLEKFAQTMDKFLEIAQGIYGRITIKKYTLSGSSHTDANIVRHLDGVITLLREKIDDLLDNYTDLINVRDELVGDAEQLKYLLTFK